MFATPALLFDPPEHMCHNYNTKGFLTSVLIVHRHFIWTHWSQLPLCPFWIGSDTKQCFMSISVFFLPNCCPELKVSSESVPHTPPLPPPPIPHPSSTQPLSFPLCCGTQRYVIMHICIYCLFSFIIFNFIHVREVLLLMFDELKWCNSKTVNELLKRSVINSDFVWLWHD